MREGWGKKDALGVLLASRDDKWPGWCSESTQCHHSKDKVISLRSNHTDPLKMDATWLKCVFNLDSFLFLTKT